MKQMTQKEGEGEAPGSKGKTPGFAASARAEMDEDEMMRRALEESARMQDSVKTIVDEEEEMIR